jgi:hypothetical protein
LWGERPSLATAIPVVFGFADGFIAVRDERSLNMTQLSQSNLDDSMSPGPHALGGV